MSVNPITGVEDQAGPQPGVPVGDAPNTPSALGCASNGKPVIVAVGNATTDAGIVAEIGADALYSDGSLYISAVAGSGALFQKRNDVWTSI